MDKRSKAKSTRPTKMSDVYSLAMVVIEVKFSRCAQSPISQSSKNLQIFTGRHPFDLYSDEQVILLLAEGLRPDKPVHEQFTPKMWSLTKKCWNKDPNKRPEVSEVLRELEWDTGMFLLIGSADSSFTMHAAGGPSRFFDSGAFFGGNSRRVTNTR